MNPSPRHEALHRIFQEDEALFTRAVARVFGVSVPEPTKVTVLSTDLTATEAIERRADSVLQAEFLVEGSTEKYVLVIESQTDPEESRLRRWPYYLAYLHDKYECPVVLAVVCTKEATAAWARKPIEIGLPGLICMTVRLKVLGPDNVPVITDAAESVSDPMLTVFSALTHSRGPALRGILETLATTLTTIDTETAIHLYEFTESGLGGTEGQQIWRALMATGTFPFKSQFRLEAEAEGHVKGGVKARTEDILRVLGRRGIEVDDESRTRITSCTDLDTLGTYLDRSLTAATAADLFD